VVGFTHTTLCSYIVYLYHTVHSIRCRVQHHLHTCHIRSLLPQFICSIRFQCHSHAVVYSPYTHPIYYATPRHTVCYAPPTTFPLLHGTHISVHLLPVPLSYTYRPHHHTTHATPVNALTDLPAHAHCTALHTAPGSNDAPATNVLLRGVRFGQRQTTVPTVTLPHRYRRGRLDYTHNLCAGNDTDVLVYYIQHASLHLTA